MAVVVGGLGWNKVQSLACCFVHHSRALTEQYSADNAGSWVYPDTSFTLAHYAALRSAAGGTTPGDEIRRTSYRANDVTI
jgi:hypothetical protein